ncbi:MAG: hypothetical protein MUD01_22610, partial [Chloroflexaceae bacterium]|nr:hypothetical protein [Chloroflexaceae bacterium]
FPGFAVTIPGKSYTLNKGLATVPQMNFYLVKGRKDTIAANPASRVQLRVPVPDGNFRVWRSFVDGCYTCGWNPNAPELRRSQLSAATSLADMQAADGEKYFYDQANGMLYLLLGPTKPVFVERGS